MAFRNQMHQSGTSHLLEELSSAVRGMVVHHYDIMAEMAFLRKRTPDRVSYRPHPVEYGDHDSRGDRIFLPADRSGGG